MLAVLSDPYAELRQQIPWLKTASLKQALRFYEEVCQHPECDNEVLAILGREDRFFLLTHLLRRADAVHPWLYARCREVEQDTDDYLDLWARDHYKSTIITFAGSIQEILKNPEVTIGIFSHTRPIAKKFLAQIKNELELNEDLKSIYSDVLYQTPARDSPSWSLDGGIQVKRTTNPREQTVEAWGLVDGQPTSMHFALGIFDDIVTRETVTTPDQIVKTMEAWELAQNLLRSTHPRRWMVGTMYKYGDPHQQLKERGAVKPRTYPATDDGGFDGNPVFLSREVWEKKKAESSTSTIAAQQLLNPAAGKEQELKPEWLRPYEVRPFTLNVYIMGDYAGGHPTGNTGSNTAFAVVGVDSAKNKYILDGACHKMTLSERWAMLKELRKKWLDSPGIQIVDVGYERYGAQSDIEHFQTMMELEGDAFSVEELNWPRDGDHPKDNRIRRLEPDLKNWRMFVPYVGEPTKRQRQALQEGQEYLISKAIKRIDENGKVYDVIEKMKKNEYLFFPNTTLKDFLDALSRIYDMKVSPPMLYTHADLNPAVAED
jgi:hypothetical protein